MGDDSRDSAGAPVNRSSSSVSGIPIVERVREWIDLFRLHVRGLFSESDFSVLEASIYEYCRYLSLYSGVSIENARALEIGYGARPTRTFWLNALGADVCGIDLDRPVLQGSFSEFKQILQSNGLERCVKSIVRFFLFDWKYRRALKTTLQSIAGPHFRFPYARLLVGDASSAQFWEDRIQCFDLIVSEDVFEHIPPNNLRALSNVSTYGTN